jgi:hypothetical protein
MTSSAASFPFRFDPDGDFSFGPGSRSSGYFGTDVLARLIAGIADFRASAEREQRSRTLGRAVLGAFMWLDDPELIDKIADFPFASVVITKQPRGRRQQAVKRQQAKLNKLQPLLEHGSGFPTEALPELEDLMLRGDDGKPPFVGPVTPNPHLHLPAIRTIGYLHPTPKNTREMRPGRTAAHRQSRDHRISDLASCPRTPKEQASNVSIDA